MNLQTDKELYEFLANAPKEFTENEKIKKFQLKNGDFIHCVLWNMHFYITGTDIVKILVWRFQNAGRQIVSLKKFEEGVFSDLRNLKPGIDATLEGPRSDFLEFLYKNGCIRTQKKQKVFFWYSVPHDALFCDALERDLRRETNLYAYSKYYSKGNFNGMPFNQHENSYDSWQAQQNMPQLPRQGMMPPQPPMMQPPMPYIPNQNPQPQNMMNNYYVEKPQFPMNKESFEPKQPEEFKHFDQKQLDHKLFMQKQPGPEDFGPSFDPKDFEMDPKDFEKHFKMFEMEDQKFNYLQEEKHLQQFEHKNFDQQQYEDQQHFEQKEHFNDRQMQNQYRQESFSENVMMPDLDEDFVEPDMIIPNKSGESEQ